MRITPVEPFERESMDPAGLRRHDILAVLPAADAAPGTHLADGVFHQRGRAGDFRAALFH